MSDFNFTASQTQAINHTFPSKLQISGGPGTGKTLVLKQIYRKIVCTNPLSDVLVLLFNSQAITNFTQSRNTIPAKEYNVFTLKQFWFSILSQYLQAQNIHLIQLSEIDFRYLKNRYSSGSSNEQNYLQQQPSILYLNSFQILQACSKYYKSDSNFLTYIPHYKYILIDQFQDIDIISFDLLLDHYGEENIIVTGDDDQSLFSWTKMTTLNSMDKVLEKFPLMRNIELNESFRCTDNILITGENMLKPIKHRIQKKVVSKNKYNRSIYLKKYSSDKKQAEQIATQIKLLHQEKEIGFQEIAILCRRRKVENNMIRAMKRFEIPIFRENLGMDTQVQVIICVMRLYLNRKDFLAKDIMEEFLKSNSEIYTNIQSILTFINEINDQMTLLQLITCISKFLRLGVNRSSYNQFTRYIYSFCPPQYLLKESIHLLISQTEMYPSNKGVSVISSLSMKGLQFKYVFIPGFNYYNYRYNSEEQENDVRKILYSTISRSSDFVCVSYFNVMNPLGLEFTKLNKKVMELEMKIEEE